MNDAPLRLFDILPMVDHSSNTSLLFLLGLTTLFTLCVVIWHCYFTPFAKLHRALKKRLITPREACHQLARMTSDEALLHDLNRIRFMRSEPTLVDVQILIKRAWNVL